MLTRLKLRNFKRFKEAEIELGESVVFVGPNNSGKSTALQALTLWDLGLRLWNSKREGKSSPEKRPGVSINRKDLISVPVPVANLLWRDLHVRDSIGVNGGKRTNNVRIDIVVEGVSRGKQWTCGLEFDYSNEESFFCRPIRLDGYGNSPVKDTKFSEIPNEANEIKVAYLPPMSGLTDREFVKQQGEIDFLIGQGRTAEVLRNLCIQIFTNDGKYDPAKPDIIQIDDKWGSLTRRIKDRFGVELNMPRLVSERSEIEISYQLGNTTLDLSCSGRGLQQTLLLMAYLYANPKTVLLLDEPDAHLEILRQRETYRMIREVAEEQGSQIISASHSEAVMQEAAGTGTVIAFVGNPHRMIDRNMQSQVLKSLTTIGWDKYLQAEQTGWVLYLEDSTDLSILQEFANILNHPAKKYLARPFSDYISTNIPQRARERFHGLREAKPDLVGICVFDRLDKGLFQDQNANLNEMMWNKKEIENYICQRDALIKFAAGEGKTDLFSQHDDEERKKLMEESILEVSQALKILNKPDAFSSDIKASDDFLEPLFKKYSEKLGQPLILRKNEFYHLVRYIKKENIDPEVIEKLDAIVRVAEKAKPVQE